MRTPESAAEVLYRRSFGPVDLSIFMVRAEIGVRIPAGPLQYTMVKKSYRLNNRLTLDELEHLKKSLSDYRLEKQREQELEEFYAKTMEQHSLDALGRFCSHSEMCAGRTTWEIYDEIKNDWVYFAEGDKVILLDDKGQKLREPVMLTIDDACWSGYFDMCKKLDIDPKDDRKYRVGLIDSDEFNIIMKEHPEFLQKLIEFTNLNAKEARAKIKGWFYTHNIELDLKKPIDIYGEQGPEPLYRFFDKHDWLSTA